MAEGLEGWAVFEYMRGGRRHFLMDEMPRTKA